jgi:hypothetical protein
MSNFTKQFDQASAVRIIGQTCKKFDISLEALRAEFPNRPTSDAEFLAVAQWMQAVWESRQNDQGTKSINPPRPSSQAKGVSVKDGYFAIPEGQLGFSKPHFFRLKHGNPKGKWANTQFLTEQASDENYPVRGARKAQILAWLAEHEDEARALYGTLISRCSRCNRTLTDHNNPYFPKYGPECGGK